ncbi:MAG: serine/threonine protein kinase [Coriobacteriales bacterium]|nr:serine/threonine protein kinase [Coriobacteriales bacterium]
MLEVGSLVDGKYRVLAKIGQGGMSVVYLAMNERANKQWAIKEVRRDGVDNYEVVKQNLIAETEYLKRLHHPNLPSIIDVIDAEDTILIVMDYIEGNSLGQALRNYGALPQDDVVKWSKQLCDVLGYLHSRKPPVIYRDTKPANIMLQPNGDVKIIDFGTAREFKEGRSNDTIPLGTQGYAAPEQYGNHQTDARTDIYNLGATMYHLVTGHNPCEPPYVMHPIRQWNPALSSGLESIIAKCTQRNPNDRYQSCAELLFDLEHYHELDHEYRRSQSFKWRLFLGAAALTLISIVGAASFAIAEWAQLQNSYDALVDKAHERYGNDDMGAVGSYYAQAIALDPTNEGAYNEFLSVIKRDQVFDEQENAALRQMLNESSGGNMTNIERFREGNPVAYDAFAYDLGLVYYFAYDGQGDKSRAESWLSIAAHSTTLDSQKRELARRLAFIATNYSVFLHYGESGGRTGLLASESFTPRDFWTEMVALSDGDLVAATGNTFVSIGIYREIIYQILTHNDIFARGGITEDEILEQLDKAQRGLQGLGTSNDEESAAITAALKQIDLARKSVETTFANRRFTEGEDSS